MKLRVIAIVFMLTLTEPSLFSANLTTHNTAALTAAKLAPEPFASHWQAAFDGSHPDYMRDQPVGHENHRVAGLLFSREAIRYLRDGQFHKAMLLASARSAVETLLEVFRLEWPGHAFLTELRKAPGGELATKFRRLENTRGA